MGVFKNRDTPKSWILIGFSIINHPFWGIIWPSGIIYHQPRFPWNKGSHFPSKRLPFGGQVVWGRYHLTRNISNNHLDHVSIFLNPSRTIIEAFRLGPCFKDPSEAVTLNIVLSQSPNHKNWFYNLNRDHETQDAIDAITTNTITQEIFQKKSQNIFPNKILSNR